MRYMDVYGIPVYVITTRKEPGILGDSFLCLGPKITAGEQHFSAAAFFPGFGRLLFRWLLGKPWRIIHTYMEWLIRSPLNQVLGGHPPSKAKHIFSWMEKKPIGLMGFKPYLYRSMNG